MKIDKNNIIIFNDFSEYIVLIKLNKTIPNELDFIKDDNTINIFELIKTKRISKKNEINI